MDLEIFMYIENQNVWMVTAEGSFKHKRHATQEALARGRSYLCPMSISDP